jgi:hypothetical protein
MSSRCWCCAKGIYRHFAGALLVEMTMPEMAKPSADVIREQRYEFLSDREIDLVIKKLETAASIYASHVTARVSVAAHKMEQALWAMRGRETTIHVHDNIDAKQ